ncbi:hypothetical protein NPIL_62771 [Nephila pilipes]|uniref:Uncharacterized protein n=1 Tax=Nephila pilipes TaxID=299642 RepID=A0A8X6UB25_NEPPI|nr:hypothetical protein NPIL_62771 [Nephila pilipes]
MLPNREKSLPFDRNLIPQIRKINPLNWKAQFSFKNGQWSQFSNFFWFPGCRGMLCHYHRSPDITKKIRKLLKAN